MPSLARRRAGEDRVRGDARAPRHRPATPTTAVTGVGVGTAAGVGGGLGGPGAAGAPARGAAGRGRPRTRAAPMQRRRGAIVMLMVGRRGRGDAVRPVAVPASSPRPAPAYPRRHADACRRLGPAVRVDEDRRAAPPRPGGRGRGRLVRRAQVRHRGRRARGLALGRPAPRLRLRALSRKRTRCGGADELRRSGYRDDVVEAILGHGDHTGVPRTSLLAKAVYACDEMTGLRHRGDVRPPEPQPRRGRRPLGRPRR